VLLNTGKAARMRLENDLYQTEIAGRVTTLNELEQNLISLFILEV
jgi:hypothetical protein